MFKRGDIVRLKDYEYAPMPINPEYIGCLCIIQRCYWDEQEHKECYKLINIENRGTNYVENLGWAEEELELVKDGD